MWSKDLLQALLERIYQVLRMAPSAAHQLLQLAGAIASSAAAAIEVPPILHPSTRLRKDRTLNLAIASFHCVSASLQALSF